MLKAAVVGVGLMGKNHARILSELKNVDLVAISDSSKERLNEFADKFGCKGYLDYKEMIKKEKLDLVSVVVPSSMHKEVSCDLIKRKINVLVEKPIAPTIQEAEEIIEFAEANKVKIMVGHIERFNPAVIELKKRINNNELGNVYKIDVNRVGPFPSRIRDVGVVIDLAVHDVDIMRYLTGSEASRIYAETEKRIHSEHEDLLSGLIKFKNNTVCNLNINWLTPTKIRKLFVTGEKGMFVVDYLRQELLFYENAEVAKNADYQDRMMGVSEGKFVEYKVIKKEPLLAEIEHFVDCILNDKQTIVTGYDGLKALELSLKILDSADKNEVVLN